MAGETEGPGPQKIDAFPQISWPQRPLLRDLRFGFRPLTMTSNHGALG
jgi:hypothetical protein